MHARSASIAVLDTEHGRSPSAAVQARPEDPHEAFGLLELPEAGAIYEPGRPGAEKRPASRRRAEHRGVCAGRHRDRRRRRRRRDRRATRSRNRPVAPGRAVTIGLRFDGRAGAGPRSRPLQEDVRYADLMRARHQAGQVLVAPRDLLRRRGRQLDGRAPRPGWPRAAPGQPSEAAPLRGLPARPRHAAARRDLLDRRIRPVRPGLQPGLGGRQLRYFRGVDALSAFGLAAGTTAWDASRSRCTSSTFLESSPPGGRPGGGAGSIDHRSGSGHGRRLLVNGLAHHRESRYRAERQLRRRRERRRPAPP